MGQKPSRLSNMNTRTHTELLTHTLNFIFRKSKTFRHTRRNEVAKLTQAAVKEKLEAWAAAEAAIEKANAAREKALAPAVEAYNQALATVGAKFDSRIEKASAEAIALYAEIDEYLGSQPKAIRLETERAIAELRIETVTKTGPRVVDAQKFIAKATSQKKDPWTCIKVEVGKAEKLLGPKDIDTVSTRTETSFESRTPVIELK